MSCRFDELPLHLINYGRKGLITLGPAQLQGKDEEVLLLHVLVLPVAVVQLDGDPVGLLPAQEGLPGTLAGTICLWRKPQLECSIIFAYYGKGCPG